MFHCRPIYLRKRCVVFDPAELMITIFLGCRLIFILIVVLRLLSRLKSA